MDITSPFLFTRLPIFNRMAIGIINFIVFALIYVVFKEKRFKDRQSQLFLAMSVFMLTWVDFAYLARYVGSSNLLLSTIYLRIAWVATPLLFFFTYLTSLIVAKIQIKSLWFKVAVGVLTLVLSLSTAIGNLVIEGVKFTNGNLDIVYGKGFFPFMAGITVIMILTVGSYITRKTAAAAKVFFVGVAIFYAANLIFNITLPVFFGITHLYYFGDYSTIFLLILTAYSIVKHRLFNVRIIAAEALIVAIWVILFSKLVAPSSAAEFLLDLIVFSTSVVVGIILARSISNEVRQKDRLQQLTSQLEQANSKLELLDKQKDEFINVAAHELRAPMTAIKGFLSMVNEGDTGSITDKTREYITDAINGNERLIRLVNNMLNISRIEEGRMVFEMDNIELVDVAREVVKNFEAEAASNSLQISLTAADNLRSKVYVDPDRIYEVVSNLVSNAVKYTEQGSIWVKLSNPNSTTVRVEVIDTGVGVTKDEQEKLFRKFERAQSSAGKTIGSGLGLYICKLLIKKFGGKIGLVSVYGKGSNFWFDLPLSMQA